MLYYLGLSQTTCDSSAPPTGGLFAAIGAGRDHTCGLYIYIYIYSLYTYIYIEREREQERHMYDIYIYI